MQAVGAHRADGRLNAGRFGSCASCLKFAPDPVRRAELRKADMFHNIDYYGGIGAPDSRLVEASWLSTRGLRACALRR